MSIEETLNIIKTIIAHLEKQKHNQSMDEDFIDGFNYAIFEIKRFYNL